MSQVDADGNGEIYFEEFCGCLKKLTIKKQTDDEVIRTCFTVFDQDNNGIISEMEFRSVFREIGGFKDPEINVIFAEADIDSNGQIDYDEFAALVREYLLTDETDSVASDTEYAVAAAHAPPFFAEGDIDSKGQIDYDEFAVLVREYLWTDETDSVASATAYAGTKPSDKASDAADSGPDADTTAKKDGQTLSKTSLTSSVSDANSSLPGSAVTGRERGESKQRHRHKSSIASSQTSSQV